LAVLKYSVLGRSRRLVAPGILFLAVFTFCSFAQQEIGIPFTSELDQGWEAISVPTQLAPLFSGIVERVDMNGDILISSASEEPGLALAELTGPAYLEVVGPDQHPWRGHRLDVATGSQSTGKAQSLRIHASTHNSRLQVDASLLLAEIQVFPHISIPSLLDQDIRWTLKKHPQTDLRLYVPTEKGFQEYRPRLSEPQGTVVWNRFDPDSGWTPGKPENLILAPGDCFVLKNSRGRGVGFGLLGLQRIRLSCQRPWLGKGPHLLGYPFSADLRLGRDWPARGGALRPSLNPMDCDYLGTYLPEGFRAFGYFGSDESTASWRELIRPGTRRAAWGAASNTLTIIPAGQGFLLYPRKDGPDHRFDPPSSPN